MDKMAHGIEERLQRLREELELKRAIAEDIRAGRDRRQASEILEAERQAAVLAETEVDIRRLEQVIVQVESMTRLN
ncbi:hypothetical protein [Shinella sp. DD12]|uniref:hypothetical protein n=1 Tax=Shinella sp. DD12 TaxID=1410620 RepID=UPI001AEC6883|nr:hypothetical protein [Shinella sp. DD12]